MLTHLTNPTISCKFGNLSHRERPAAFLEELGSLLCSVLIFHIAIILYGLSAVTHRGRAQRDSAAAQRHAVLTPPPAEQTKYSPLLHQLLHGPRRGFNLRDSPEYLPPLLLLMKQRMSSTSSSSTTALTTPMNQPCVAMLCCTSVTSAWQRRDRGEEGGERQSETEEREERTVI